MFPAKFVLISQAVSEEKICLTLAKQKQECSWQPYLFGKRNETKKLYRGPYIDASCPWPPRAIHFSDLLLLKQSSPLKLLGQMEPNLAGSIYVRPSIKFLRSSSFRGEDLLNISQSETRMLLAAIFVWQTE
jgi:hypothetical protein